MEDLTRRLDDSREECERKVLAFEVANDQAQRCQRKLEGEVKKLKEKAEQTKSQFSVTLEENNNLKQMVREDIYTHLHATSNQDFTKSQWHVNALGGITVRIG